MAGYRIFIKPSAAKELEAIPSLADRQRIVKRNQGLAQTPRPYDCQKLTCAEKYRIRCGVYRIIYAIEDDKLVILIVKIGHRRDVYR